MKAQTPLVTVLMPVYNAEEFLIPAIDGILNQTYTNFEFILINDGSTDRSEKIINSYSDPRIKYYSQNNVGVAKTLNNGIPLASGKYIWRHDADDICLPDKLEKQVAFLEQNKEYCLCATQVAFMTESGNVSWKFRQPKNAYFQDNKYVEVKREHFNPFSPITHATVLIKTEDLKNVNGYRTEFKTAEDVDLWLRLLHNHKAAVLNDCNYFVRLSKASATQKYGWKNKFYKDLAFQYFNQRAEGKKDDLQNGGSIVEPAAPDNVIPTRRPGREFRSDLLNFNYALHINAKDWAAVKEIILLSLKDGWKIKSTWRAILFPLLGEKTVQTGVKLKSLFR